LQEIEQLRAECDSLEKEFIHLKDKVAEAEKQRREEHQAQLAALEKEVTRSLPPPAPCAIRLRSSVRVA
jgi:hypothetical protein